LIPVTRCRGTVLLLIPCCCPLFRLAPSPLLPIRSPVVSFACPLFTLAQSRASSISASRAWNCVASCSRSHEALAPPQCSPRVDRQFLSVCGILLIVFSCCFSAPHSVSRPAGSPVLGAAMLILSRPSFLNHRILGSRFCPISPCLLRWYLWHWPAGLSPALHCDQLPIACPVGAAALVLTRRALLYLVEKPCAPPAAPPLRCCCATPLSAWPWRSFSSL